jgi:hypothetical protein
MRTGIKTMARKGSNMKAIDSSDPWFIDDNSDLFTTPKAGGTQFEKGFSLYELGLKK